MRRFLRDRFDVIPSTHRTKPVAVGLVVIILATLALLSAALRHIPLTPTGGRVIQAEFTAADQVSSRTVVRVGGVEVGHVESVGPGSNPYRSSIVRMRLANDRIALRADASAQIRWRTVFGGLVFIDLHPGSSSSPALGDRAIPAKQTSNQVEIDQLLETYTGPTAQTQRNLLRGLRNSFADPARISQSVRTLGPALGTVDRGMRPLHGTVAGDLKGLVSAAARTVAGLDDTARLQDLVVGAQRTLAATDTNRADLGALLQQLPPSLQSTSTTMQRLRTTLGHLDPLVARLHPGARALAPAARAATPALTAADAVLADAGPLLRAAGPTLDALRKASASGVPLLRALDPTLQRLIAELLPFLSSRDSGTKLRIYESIGPFFASIDSAASEFDSVGHRIRLLVPPSIAGFLTTP
jgi:phospholipid/cholesterol/gamma-HCH transport system substrate-binding protein